MGAKNTGISSALNRVRRLVRKGSYTTDSIATSLCELQQQLANERFDALAYVAETCARATDLVASNVPDGRDAMLDLCDRISAAVKTNLPMSFDSIHPTLMRMLFSEPEPEVVSATESIEISTQAELDVAVIPSEPTGMVDDESISGVNPDSLDALCECEDLEILGEFLSEAVEHIENAEQLMLVLEESPRDAESINGVFRAVHSIKGAAGFLRLDALASVAHRAESVLVRVREGELTLRDSLFDVILSAVDFLGRQIKCLQEAYQAKQPLHYPIAPPVVIQCLEQACEDGCCDATKLAKLKELMIPAESEEESTTISSKAKANNDSLRVDGKRLGQLIDLIGELVITEGAVQRQLGELHSLTAASVGAQLRKVVREVQQMSLTLKMVPIGAMLQKMNRMVRDLSEKLDKPTRVVIHGADTEVDKTLLECITDPLVHLIRNSIDHGIEPNVAARRAAGKPDVATVTLTAEHRSGNIHITIADDGRGLDRERILSRAIERGLVPASAKLSDQEIDHLIFAPGFSTAAVVSDVSGRGVGMDVVRKNVESMRGNIQLRSTPGQGTQIRLELPLTLSIIDGTVVRIGDRAFIIPTLSVIEQLQAASAGLTRTSNGNMVSFRGRYISGRQLGDIIGATHNRCVRRGQVCMVVETCGELHALFVDEILGQQPIVIKPLGSILEDFQFYAGGALLADGEIAFVLDLNSVCQNRSTNHNTPTLEKQSA